MSSPKKAFSYIRMSTPEQLKGDSLRRQLEASRQWCDQNGYTLDDALRDIGVSAFRGLNRLKGSLGTFIELAQAGDVEPGSVLLLESLDRLSRQEVLESLSLFTEILSTGVEIVTLSDNQHYTRDSIGDLGNLIISLVVMSRAHEESKMKSQRLSQAWSQKRKMADERPLTAQVPFWLKLDKRANEIVVVPERAEIIREIFERTIAGFGRHALVRDFNERKVAPFGRAKKWHSSYIAKVLNNRAVIGEYQPYTGKGKDRQPVGDPVKSYYPEVIDEITFYRAKAACKSRRNKGGVRGHRFSNLLHGFGRCAKCGSNMRYLNKGVGPKSGGSYLACADAIVMHDCDNHRHYRYSLVEKLFLVALAEHADWYTSVAGDSSKKKQLSDKQDAFEARLAEIKTAVERYSLLFETAPESQVALMTERFKELLSEQLDIEKELEALKSQVSDATSTSDMSRAIYNVIAKFERTDAELYSKRAELNQALKKLISSVTFADDYDIRVNLTSGEEFLLSTDEDGFNNSADNAAEKVGNFIMDVVEEDEVNTDWFLKN